MIDSTALVVQPAFALFWPMTRGSNKNDFSAILKMYKKHT